MATNPSRRCFTATRWASGTCGTPTVAIFTRITRSWTMPLCSAFLRSAVGTVSSEVVRNTADPGIRFGGSSIMRLM